MRHLSVLLLALLLASVGALGVVLGEADDSPGLQLLGVLLVLVGGTLAARRLRPRPVWSPRVCDMADVVLGRAGPDEAGELLTLQRAAFVGEAARYDAFDHPALLQTLEELRSEMETVEVHTARLAHRLVGAVRVRREGSTLHVARIAVAPDLQGHGIGSRLLRQVEETADEGVARFALFTGSRSDGNLRLYARLGYAERRRETLSPDVVLVHLDKQR